MCCQLSLRFVLVSLYLRLYSVVSVSVTHFYRSASPKATKRFPGVDLFVGRVSSRYEKIIIGDSPPWKKKGLGTLVCIVIIHTSRFSFRMSY